MIVQVYFRCRGGGETRGRDKCFVNPASFFILGGGGRKGKVAPYLPAHASNGAGTIKDPMGLLFCLLECELW